MKVRNVLKQQLQIIFCLFVLCLGSGCSRKERDTFQDISIQESGESSVEQDNFSGSKEDTVNEQKENSIYVYVCGAVNQTGVYELKKDARAYEAIECAGGLLEDAATLAVNQAEILSDGQQLYIPTQEEYEAGNPTNITDSAQLNTSDGKIHLNTATKEELTTLTGIGESRAESIIAYRETHGSFQNIEELMNVDGIKEGIFQKIKEQIAL